MLCNLYNPFQVTTQPCDSINYFLFQNILKMPVGTDNPLGVRGGGAQNTSEASVLGDDGLQRGGRKNPPPNPFRLNKAHQAWRRRLTEAPTNQGRDSGPG
jgi:hypothetical protein